MTQPELVTSPPVVDVERFVIPGEPMPMPRPRMTTKPFPKIYVPTKATKEMKRIRDLWNAESRSEAPAGVPLALTLTYGVSRPQAHYSASGTVKERFMRARPLQRGKGDLDNLVKLTLDGLQHFDGDPGAFFADDQIVELAAVKGYFDSLGLTEPCTVVEIRALP